MTNPNDVKEKQEPKISKETVMKAFEMQMKQAQDQLKNLQTTGMGANPGASQAEQMQVAMKMMVEEAKKQD